LPVLIASGFADSGGLTGTSWPRLRKPYTLSELSVALATLGPARQVGNQPAGKQS
jgi:hypothetical protein